MSFGGKNMRKTRKRGGGMGKKEEKKHEGKMESKRVK
jgi:hypothetical protein